MESETESMPWSWREQRRYLQEIAPYFFASIALLAAGTGLGFATSDYAPELSRERREALREFVSLFTGLPKPYLALAIFLNNALKTLLVIVAGTLGGVPPLVFLLVNGYVLGMVLYSTMQSQGAAVFFLSIAPHGIFELPGVLLGTSIGLNLGLGALKRLFGKTGERITVQVARGLRFFVALIVPLLLIAASIEALLIPSMGAK